VTASALPPTQDITPAHHPLLHPFASVTENQGAAPIMMVRADGVHVYDSAGAAYLDGMSGMWCVNVGYGRDEIVQAMADQARRLPFYHTFLSSTNEPAARLADRLTRLAPAGHRHVFFGVSGSDANDTQVKLVWYYNNVRGRPRKKKILAHAGGYHGSTVAAASLTGLPAFHSAFDLPLDRFLHVPDPHLRVPAAAGDTPARFAARLAEELDARIRAEGPDTVAAFFAEPVLCAGGVIVPPREYFRALQPVLREHDVLLVVDEVICGFGRLGTLFGSEYFGIEPDLVTLAKGLTSGYAPMSACLISDRVWEVLETGSRSVGPFAHGGTYSGHPVAAAAALANLDVIEREGLVARADRVGTHLQQRLRRVVAGHPLVGEVRGLGMLAAVELSVPGAPGRPFPPAVRAARRLHTILEAEERLLCRPIGEAVAFCPALTFTEAQIDDLVARVARALAKLHDRLTTQGLV
jgi:L-2,4-diaminobutyrate transaminase